MSSVAERLEAVRQRIRTAAERAGRDPSTIRLVAVSKTQPAEAIRAAYEAGQRDFGENYVQELLQKQSELADLPELRWHLIGHLQTNKVAKVASVVSAVHSVDSPKLARELGKRALAVAPERRLSASGRPWVFVEVNVSREPQKSGVAPEALGELLDAVEREPLLELVGLMTVPAGNADPEQTRQQLEALVRLRDAHGGAARLPELSLGMSGDLELAVACGSTCVRIGTDLFGART